MRDMQDYPARNAWLKTTILSVTVFSMIWAADVKF